MRWLNNRFLLVLLLNAVLLLAACTVTPDLLESAGPSWDGGQRNSGLLGFRADGQGVLTPQARLRYQALAQRYGTNWSPAVTGDSGVQPFTNGTWAIDQEHLTKFAIMNRWRKEGR